MCWPIYDRIQAREFRSLFFKWLEGLKKQGILPPELMIRKSFLDEGRGERLERILLYLCQTSLQKKCPELSNINTLASSQLYTKTILVEQKFTILKKEQTEWMSQAQATVEQLTKTREMLLLKKESLEKESLPIHSLNLLKKEEKQLSSQVRHYLALIRDEFETLLNSIIVYFFYGI